MLLYIIEVRDGDPGRLSWRAVQRIGEADVVVADRETQCRFAAILPRPAVEADPVALARRGQKVAWLTRKRWTPKDVPWEFLPAVSEAEAFSGTRPLDGMGVVVTRPRQQAAPLLSRLEELGARAYGIPSIVIEPHPELPALDVAVQDLKRYQWLLFTSANAIAPFMQRLRAARLDARALAGLRIGCIGPATASALQEHGLVPDVVPETYVAEGLLAALGDVAGQRFLLPRAEEAREILPQTLRENGAEIDVIPVYRTVSASGEGLPELFATGAVHAVTFTASSTVRHFPLEIPEGVAVVCIGPITARTARERGWTVTREADVYTAEGVVDALVDLWPALRRVPPEVQKRD